MHIALFMLKNSGIYGVILESNVGVYVIYMQCEFIPGINLFTSVFMMLCNGFYILI
jgi:hypothetical protein